MNYFKLNKLYSIQSLNLWSYSKLFPFHYFPFAFEIKMCIRLIWTKKKNEIKLFWALQKCILWQKKYWRRKKTQYVNRVERQFVSQICIILLLCVWTYFSLKCQFKKQQHSNLNYVQKQRIKEYFVKSENQDFFLIMFLKQF